MKGENFEEDNWFFFKVIALSSSCKSKLFHRALKTFWLWQILTVKSLQHIGVLYIIHNSIITLTVLSRLYQIRAACYNKIIVLQPCNFNSMSKLTSQVQSCCFTNLHLGGSVAMLSLPILRRLQRQCIALWSKGTTEYSCHQTWLDMTGQWDVGRRCCSTRMPLGWRWADTSSISASGATWVCP